MSMEITEKAVTETLKAILIKEEFKIIVPRKSIKDNTGVDLLAVKNEEKNYIEIKGFCENKIARSKKFFEVFFQALSRLNYQDATNVIIALPKEWESGIITRANITYKNIWTRIGNAFPELNIWLIDTEKQNYKRTLWNDWKK